MGSRFQKSYVVTIPASTSVLTRIINGLVFSGRLTFLNIDIPKGWDYSAGVQVRFGDSKYPVEDTSGALDVFSGDDTDLPLHPNAELNEEKLQIYGQNNDTVEHSCVVTIEIEQDDEQEDSS